MPAAPHALANAHGKLEGMWKKLSPPHRSQVDVESLQDHLPAEWAVALVYGLLQQDFSALLAEAKMPAGK